MALWSSNVFKLQLNPLHGNCLIPLKRVNVTKSPNPEIYVPLQLTRVVCVMEASHRPNRSIIM